ncbi:MAG: GFA family protein [Cyanobacteria bacterium P01_H01_bin.21]
MIKGSCLCGAIAYELSERPEIMNLCHCAMCRKILGSSYGTFAHIEIGKFRWICGEENVQRY